MHKVLKSVIEAPQVSTRIICKEEEEMEKTSVRKGTEKDTTYSYKILATERILENDMEYKVLYYNDNEKYPVDLTFST